MWTLSHALLTFQLSSIIHNWGLQDAMTNNFVVDAIKDPAKFLANTGLNLCTKMLEHGLRYPAVLARIIISYISDADLAWTEVVSIRAVEGASHENQYSSINTELLNAAYFNTNLSKEVAIAPKDTGCTVQKESTDNLNFSTENASDGNKNLNEAGNEKPNYAKHVDCKNEQYLFSGHGKHQAIEKLFNCKHQPHSYNDNISNNFLITIFSWIKDLPKLLQQQILSSFSMQQALKLVQPATHLDEFVSNRPLEEQFKTDYQKYYAQDYFIDSVKRYAEISQGNAMLIGDSLSQQEINFRTPFLDA